MKKRISILMILTILIFTIRVDYVKAASNFDAKNAIIKSVKEAYEQGQRSAQMLIDLWHAVGDITGFISNKTLVNADKIIDWFRGYSAGGHGFSIPENSTDDAVVEKALEYLITNITVNDDSFTWNDNSRNAFVYINDQVKNDEPWDYMYSYDIAETVTQWNNGVIYNRVRDIVRDHQNEYYVLYSASSVNANDTTNFYFWFIPKTDDMQFCRYIGAWDTVHIGIASYRTWEWVLNENYYTSVSCNVYKFDGETLELYETRPQSIYTIGLQSDSEGSNIGNQNGAMNTNPVFVSTVSGKDQVILWDSLNAMKQGSLGQRGYYVTDSYNRNVSGSYNTFNSSNSNNITYGDINTYINNYYNQNGEYPTQPEINIYINNNIPSGDGGSGSNSGQGATAAATATTGNVTVNNNINVGWPVTSGNSISQNDIDQGTSSIFGFISSIGKYLADLVKNLGSALAQLISAITSIIADITENIPNLFSGIIEIVFSGLPAEIRSIILLGITLMVTYGIFKMIRG